MKKFFALFFTVLCIVVLTVCFTACDNLDINNTKQPTVYQKASTLNEIYTCNPEDMPSKTDFTYPQDFNTDSVILHFYTPETGWALGNEDAPFDESKPTVVFAHGMGPDLHMYTPETYYAMGYNVASFMWGTFSNATLLEIEFAIWDRINYYMIGSDKVESDDFDCTVTELYAATYCDFFRQYPTYTMPITFCGHSYGGQLTYAIALYLTKALRENRLEARLFPEKFTLLDPYSDTLDTTFNCRWLGETITGSSYGAAAAHIDKLLDFNVPIEVLRTSPYVKMAMMMGSLDTTVEQDPEYINEFMHKVSYLELSNSSVIISQHEGSMADKISRVHTVAMSLYFGEDAFNIYYTEDGSPVFGRENPASAVRASHGIHYDFTINGGYVEYEKYSFATTYTDDYTEDNAKVAGCVYLDANANTIFDDGSGARVDNATVELYKDGEEKPVTATTLNGYYEFELEKDAKYKIEIHSSNYGTVTKEFTADKNITIQDILLTATK